MTRLHPSDFAPRFGPRECAKLIEVYKPHDDDEIAEVAQSIREAGYATLAQLTDIVRWKSPRPIRHVERSTDADVQEITSITLRSDNERVRLLALTLLPGVAWPVASVFLHWCHRDPYPILDFRAWWSLGRTAGELDAITLEDWLAYSEACRHWSAAYQLSMRDFDRALWAYSKMNQSSD